MMTKRFNPLDTLDTAAIDHADRVELIVCAIVPDGDPKHVFWVEGARTVIAGFLDLSMRGESKYNSISEASGPPSLSWLRDIMHLREFPVVEMGRLGGMAKEAASLLDHTGHDTFNLILATAANHIRWLKSDAVCYVLSRTDLPPRHDSGPPPILLMPDEYNHIHTTFIRLMVDHGFRHLTKSRDRRCLSGITHRALSKAREFVVDPFQVMGEVAPRRGVYETPTFTHRGKTEEECCGWNLFSHNTTPISKDLTAGRGQLGST
jgi:type IV secretory pathway TraG/TraD family ATPase VirD4